MNEEKNKDYISDQIPNQLPTLKMGSELNQEQTNEATGPYPERQSSEDSNQSAWNKLKLALRIKKKKEEKGGIIEKGKKTYKKFKILKWIMAAFSCSSVIIGGTIIAVIVVIIILAVLCNENKAFCAFEWLKNFFN